VSFAYVCGLFFLDCASVFSNVCATFVIVDKRFILKCKIALVIICCQITAKYFHTEIFGSDVIYKVSDPDSASVYV
jgi:hypothetical protein